MTISVQALKNAVVLGRFEELTGQGCCPSLAVYGGREIVLIEKETGLIAVIMWLWRHFQFTIGVLSSKQEVLQTLKQEAFQWCFNLTNRELQEKLKGVNIEILGKKKTVETLNVSISGLEQKVATLTKETCDLEERSKVAKAELDNHICHFEKCKTAKTEIKALEVKKAALNAELDEVAKSYATLPGKKEEIARLTTTISDLEAQVEALTISKEQHDFQKRYTQVAEDAKKLYRIIGSKDAENKELTCRMQQAEAISLDRIQKLDAEVVRLTSLMREMNCNNQQEIQRLHAEIASLAGELGTRRISVGSGNMQTMMPPSTQAADPGPAGNERINPGDAPSDTQHKEPGNTRIPVKQKRR